MYSPTIPISEYLEGEQTKYPELTMDAIETLKDALKNDRDLPHIKDKMYSAFLHSCYFDLELAKFTIKKYYKYFFEIPQVFCYNLDPLSEDIEQMYRCIGISPMPASNLDKSDRVLYLELINENPSAFDFPVFYKYLTMWLRYHLLTFGSCDGIVVLIDSKGLSWRHIIKLPIGITAKLLKFLELGLPVRLKTIHFLNAGTSIQMLMKIIARFANEELLEKIKIHAPGSEDIFNQVPRHLMPIEAGGTAKSFIHYNDELYKNLVERRDFFIEEFNELTSHITDMDN